MGILQNALGTHHVRLGNYPILSQYVLCCFFESCNVAPTVQLMPQDVITDFCDTWDLDGNGDIMPEAVPGLGGCWEIDSNGDIMPEAV